MRRWLELVQDTGDGQMIGYQLVGPDGTTPDSHDAFIEQLTNHLVGYALHHNVTLDGDFDHEFQLPAAINAHLHPESMAPLTGDTYPYRVLKGFSGECLAHWAYCTIGTKQPGASGTLIAISEPKYGSTDPAFDLLAIYRADEDLQVACIQAKVSAGGAAGVAREGAHNYARLHGREFDFSLAGELQLLARRPAIRAHLGTHPWRAVLLQPERFQYVLFVAHDGAPPVGARSEWPGEWAGAIPVAPSQRVLLALPLANCNGLMEALRERLCRLVPGGAIASSA